MDAIVYAQPENAAFVHGTRRQIAGMSFGDWLLWGGFGLLLALISIAGLLSSYTTQQILANGVETEAVILDRRVQSGRNTRYYLTYRYVGGTTHYTRDEAVDPGVYGRVSEGATVPVRYLPDQPGQARLAGRFASNDDSPWLFVISGVCALLIAWVLAMDVWEVRHLSRHGKLLDGTLLSAYGRYVNREGYKVTFRYQFPLSSGRYWTGERTVKRGDLRHAVMPPRGSPVKVIYVNDDSYRML